MVAATCVCVCVFECEISMHLSPVLKYLSLAENAFVHPAKCDCLQHNKHVRLLFGRWFKEPLKKIETKGKVSVQLHFSQGWG